MENGQGPYVHEKEVKGVDINIEVIESNGHREGMEPLTLVEITRSLKMKV